MISTFWTHELIDINYRWPKILPQFEFTNRLILQTLDRGEEQIGDDERGPIELIMLKSYTFSPQIWPKLVLVL